MSIITTKQLKDDIKDGDKRGIFELEFPDQKPLLDKAFSKPDCGICFRQYLTAIFETVEFDEKIKLIYGEDTEVDKTFGIQPRSEIIVEDVLLDDWKTWFETNCKPTPVRRIQLMNTFFNPVKRTVTVSMVVMIGQGRRR